MARYWETKEVAGRGTQHILVIDPEDGTNPIRTYGWSKDEVLEKIARTAETAQQTINRMRQEPTNGGRPVTPPPAPEPTAKKPTADEILQATSELSNPAKAGDAITTLLRAKGIDLDQQRLREQITAVGNMGQRWQQMHSEYPADPRNDRLMIDKVKAIARDDWGAITLEMFDQAFNYLRANGLLFEPAEAVPTADPAPASAEPTNPQPARPAEAPVPVERPRVATSVRSTALRGAVPAPTTPKPRYTRAEIEAMNSRQLADKIKNEPGFEQWFNTEFSTVAR